MPRDLDLYTQLGVGAIGLNWRKLNEYGLRRSLKRIRKSPLAVSSVGWISGFTGQYGHRLKDTLLEARKMIRVAGVLRAPVIPVITGPRAGHIRSHAARLIGDSLRDLAPLASIYGVRLALQPMHPIYRKNWTFLNSVDQTLEILDRVDHPHVMMSFGMSHLIDQPGVMDRLSDLVPRIAIVGLSDRSGELSSENDGLIPGTGDLPIRDAIATLEQAGYTGWYEIEVWSPDLWKLQPHDLIQGCLLAKDRLAASLAPLA
ncbi:MAG: sugar phosphate isomerase/epimerase [Planctomycetaceae bacterium]|nr:sugar phosphate isomerase/epimerase [Planctomycetaceae bacterium]